jgi:hypothetical protein
VSRKVIPFRAFFLHFLLFARGKGQFLYKFTVPGKGSVDFRKTSVDFGQLCGILPEEKTEPGAVAPGIFT